MSKAKAEYNISIFNETKLNRFINSIQSAIENLPKVASSVQKKYNKKVKNDLEYIARSAVDSFYDSYPTEYDRMGDLYNAFKIIANDNEWGVDYSASYMQFHHHQSNDFIFENSFISGYHGGSWGVDKHGEVAAVPYYREPYGIWSRWSFAAKKTKSPYDLINEKVDVYLIDTKDEMSYEFSDRMKPYLDRIRNNLKNLYN